MYQSFNSKLRFKVPSVDWSYQKGSLNGDGYGVGWYLPFEMQEGVEEGEQPCVFVSSRPAWNDSNLVGISKKTLSRCFFAHVRAASSIGSYVTEANSHPFKMGRYMFMHNGGLGDWNDVRSQYLALVSPEKQNYVMAQACLDSVVVFAIIMDFLVVSEHDRCTAHQLRMAIANTFDLLMAFARVHKVSAQSSLNICITDGFTTIATRFSLRCCGAGRVDYPSLFLAIGQSWERSQTEQTDITEQSDDEGEGDVGVRKKQGFTTVDYRMRGSKAAHDVVLIASEPLSSDASCWLPVEPGEVIILQQESGISHVRVYREAVIPCPWNLDLLTAEHKDVLRQWYWSLVVDGFVMDDASSKVALKVGLPKTLDAYGPYRDTIVRNTIRPDPMFGVEQPQATSYAEPGGIVEEQLLLREVSKTGPLPKASALALVLFERVDGRSRRFVISGHDDGAVVVTDADEARVIGRCQLDGAILCMAAYAEVDGEESYVALFCGLDDGRVAIVKVTDICTENRSVSVSARMYIRIQPTQGCCCAVAINESFDDEYEFKEEPERKDSSLKFITTSTVSRAASATTVVSGLKLIAGFVSSRILAIDLATILSNVGELPAELVYSAVRENQRESRVSGLEIVLKPADDATVAWTQKYGEIDMALLGYTNDLRHVASVDTICPLGNGLFLSAGKDSQILKWDHNGRCIQAVVSGHGDMISDLAFDAETNFLYSAGVDGNIRVWDCVALSCITVLKVCGSPITGLKISQGLLTATYGDTLLLLCTRTFKVCAALPLGHSEVVTVAGLPTRGLVVTSSVDGFVRQWTLPECQEVGVDKNTGQHSPALKAILSLHSGDTLRGRIHHMLQEITSFRAMSGIQESIRQLHLSASFLENQLRSLGCETRLAPCGADIAPVVIGRLGRAKNKKTLLFYGHYDVVPPAATVTKSDQACGANRECETGLGAWESDPWTLTLSNGYYVGRGVNDNRGPIVAQINAVRELRDLYNGDLPLNVVFLYDGDEEQGSRGLRERILEHADVIGNVDLVLCNNAQGVSDVAPTIITGMRGVIDFDVTVSNNMEGCDSGWHTGHQGGAVIEPMWVLTRLVNNLFSRSGRILIPQFYDNVDSAITRRGMMGASGFKFSSGVFNLTAQPGKTKAKSYGDIHRTSSIEVDLPTSFNAAINKEESLANSSSLYIEWKRCAAILHKHDPEQKFNEPCTYDGDVRLSLARKSYHPCLSLVGVTTSCSDMGRVGRIIPKWARASLSMRIVPHQEADAIVLSIKQFLGQEFVNFGHQLKMNVVINRVHNWWNANDYERAGLYLDLVEEALEEEFQEKPIRTREGGTVPLLSTISDIVGAPTIQVAMAGPTDKAHMENERISAEQLFRHSKALIRLLPKIASS